MPVSKRLRFEILRRDNHTCRYCGASAPDVPLRVDHVTPEALGGRTEPSNLVTACEPCNSGKSSVALDGATVEDIKADALRLAELQRQAYAVLVAQGQDRRRYEDDFVSATEPILLLPADWRASIGRWHDMGVPLDLVIDAADVAMWASGVADRNRFKYMCGIVWNRVQLVTAEASDRLALDGAWVTRDQRVQEREQAKTIGFADGARAFAAEIDSARTVEDFVDRHKRPAGMSISEIVAGSMS